MKWLSSPKVRLALIVNGLYLISHFVAPSPPHARPRFFEQARASLNERAHRPVRAHNVPLQPPAAPSRATADESGGVLHISLKKDLTLVRRPGRTLLLSPSFSVSKSHSEEPGPSSVLLTFIIYANEEEEACPGDCPLTIAADGKVVWPDYRRTDIPGYSQGWVRKLIPYSSIKSADGRVIETLAAESLSLRISYDQFIDTISARRVIFKLGPDRVELTPDQIEALRDMHRSLL